MAQTAKTSGAWGALSDELAGAVERVASSVVAIYARERIPSSGILWRDDVVLTANHTIHREEDIRVVLDDGTSRTATIAGRDSTTDIAVLRLGGSSEPTTPGRGTSRGAPANAPSNPRSAPRVAEIGDAGGLRAGDLVLGVGRPGRNVTGSLGLVRLVGGEWRTWRGGTIDRLIRLDMDVRDGFSGGALVGAGGGIIGLTTSGLARGAAIALPAATINRVGDQLLASGRIPRGYLGLGVQPMRIPESLATALGLAGRTGAMVMIVEPGSPADESGVLMGDVLVEIDGTPAGRVSDLASLLGPEQVGKRVVARIVRSGKVRELTLTIGDKPPRAA